MQEKSQEKNIELENRFVDFTCTMIDIVEALPNNRAGNYMAEQLVRSCHSPTFNYGDTHSAESRNEFIQKLGLLLKYLKECRTALKIIRKKEMIKPIVKLEAAFSETEQLIAIIGKSLSTARKNKGKLTAKAAS